VSLAVSRRQGWSVRSGLYAALVAINLDQADFDNGCDVRRVTAIKREHCWSPEALWRDRALTGNGPTNIAQSVGRARCRRLLWEAGGYKATPWRALRDGGTSVAPCLLTWATRGTDQSDSREATTDSWGVWLVSTGISRAAWKLQDSPPYLEVWTRQERTADWSCACLFSRCECHDESDRRRWYWSAALIILKETCNSTMLTKYSVFRRRPCSADYNEHSQTQHLHSTTRWNVPTV